MADKSISELVGATSIGSVDLFVLEQSGTAKKLTGQILENWLVSYADGHGGIQSLVKTSSTGTDPVVDVYTFTYADTTTSSFTVTNGKKGATGARTYVWIKYSSRQPVQDSDIYDTPDDWVGIYVGLSSSAPTSYTAYTWYSWKGETGDPAELQSNSVTYQASAGGTTIPSGIWLNEPPYVQPGQFLWTRVILGFNSGDPVTYYTVSRYGVDGQGSAGTSTPLPDNTDGAVGTSLSFSREDHQHPLPTASNILMTSGHTVQADVAELLTFEALHIVGTVSASALYITDARITADMRVIECTWGTPTNVQSDIAWTTTAGRITFSGTFGGSTTVDLILGKTN